MTPDSCPFCGNENTRVTQSQGIAFVACDDCHTSGPKCQYRNVAIAVWNRAPKHRNQLTIASDSTMGLIEAIVRKLKETQI